MKYQVCDHKKISDLITLSIILIHICMTKCFCALRSLVVLNCWSTSSAFVSCLFSTLSHSPFVYFLKSFLNFDLSSHELHSLAAARWRLLIILMVVRVLAPFAGVSALAVWPVERSPLFCAEPSANKHNVAKGEWSAYVNTSFTLTADILRTWMNHNQSSLSAQ